MSARVINVATLQQPVDLSPRYSSNIVQRGPLHLSSVEMEIKESEADGYVFLEGASTGLGTELPHDAPRYTAEIDRCINGLRDILWPLNKYIHDNPEIAFQEHKAHDNLVAFMQSRKGWEVTPHAFNIDTAWIATFRTGRRGPIISFNAEMGQ